MRPELVTIFGGSGFVGRHIVRLLAKEGYRIRVAVRRPHVAHFLRPMGMVGQIQLTAANFNDEATIAAALEGADIVINAVGILAQGGRQRFKKLHAEAPATIARLAKEKGATRLVQISSIGADPKAPSRYARTKGEGEVAIRRAFPEATILRPSIVFGPEDSFFNRFANMSRYLPFLPLIGGGKTRFQPVFVDDVARAVAACLADPATASRTYELGGPQVLSFRECMEVVRRETGRRPHLLSIPFLLARLQGLVLGLLPGPILTHDQVVQLKRDNVVGRGASPGEVGTLADLGIEPVSLEAVVPTYLWRFRRQGQFEEAQSAR